MTDSERLTELLDSFSKAMNYASVAIIRIELFDAFAVKRGFSEATAQRLRQEIAAKTTDGKAPVYAVIDYSHERFGVLCVEEQPEEAIITFISAASVTIVSDIEDEIHTYNAAVGKQNKIKPPFSMRILHKNSGGKRNLCAEYAQLGEKLQAGTPLQREFYNDHKDLFDMCENLDKYH